VIAVSIEFVMFILNALGLVAAGREVIAKPTTAGSGGE